ncbi:MAG TPA: glycosyltransferase family A protein [Chloroflexia bacterium]|nr:glycosyltransferase family A protein [Chloroflexia bacterium]
MTAAPGNGGGSAGPVGRVPIEIGILTEGKPTLAMALSSLLLQNTPDIRIHIVDTSERPVIHHEDFSSAMRLAFDRGIACSYEHRRDRQRPFSIGKMALLEALPGPHICFMDDDVVLPTGSLTLLRDFVAAHTDYGYLAPALKNPGTRRTALGGRTQFAPGTLFRQDATVRAILLDYYGTTNDVLDHQKKGEQAWEVAFLTEMFPLLGRPCYTQPDNVIYHLDYHEGPNWELLREDLLASSRAKARALVRKHAGSIVEPAPDPSQGPAH